MTLFRNESIFGATLASRGEKKLMDQVRKKK